MTNTTSGHDHSAPHWQSLRGLRETAGYSIDDLAETCGLTHAEITAIEEGRDADEGKIARITAALKSTGRH